VLSLPISTVVVGISKLEELAENIRLAREFKPLSSQEMASIEDVYRPHAAQATWFKQKW